MVAIRSKKQHFSIISIWVLNRGPSTFYKERLVCIWHFLCGTLPGTGKMDYPTGSQDTPEASLGLHDASSEVDGVRVEGAIFWFFTKSHSLRKQLSLNPDVICKLLHQAFLSSLSVTEPTGCYTVITISPLTRNCVVLNMKRDHRTQRWRRQLSYDANFLRTLTTLILIISPTPEAL